MNYSPTYYSYWQVISLPHQISANVDVLSRAFLLYMFNLNVKSTVLY